jgi:hypothetical protein
MIFFYGAEFTRAYATHLKGKELLYNEQSIPPGL